MDIKNLPKLKSVHYTNVSSNLDARNMTECDLNALTTVTKLSKNFYVIKYSSGELIPIPPTNASDNRVYYHRRTTNTAWRKEPLNWVHLRIHTGPPLSVIRKSL